MSRPWDWSAAAQPGDPTPGEAWGVRALASTYRQVAEDAGQAHTLVRSIEAAASGGVWVGEAADSFRAKLGSFPAEVRKCRDSYQAAAEAVSWWAGRLEDAQARADRGLSLAIQAQHDLTAANQALLSAAAGQADAGAAVAAMRLDPGAELGWDGQGRLRSARNREYTAHAAVASASGSVQDAQQRLEAARRLVAQAHDSYETDAAATVVRIKAATEAGVSADTWWQQVYHSDAWATVVGIATTLAVTAAIAAIFLTGPIALLVAGIAIAAGALLTANDLAAYREGEQSGHELLLGMAAMFIPGGKAMRAAQKSLKGVENAGTKAERAAATTASIRGTGGTTIDRATRTRQRIADIDRRLANPKLEHWERNRLLGQRFDLENHHRYPHNELVLNTGKRLDSYIPGAAIVSRKYTQLADITPKTAKSYINEAVAKYGPREGRTIKTTGEELDGDLILEVPVQNKPVPPEIVKYAATRKTPVTIRDVTGRPHE